MKFDELLVPVLGFGIIFFLMGTLVGNVLGTRDVLDKYCKSRDYDRSGEFGWQKRYSTYGEMEYLRLECVKTTEEKYQYYFWSDAE